jgi:hypothetical protein
VGEEKEKRVREKKESDGNRESSIVIVFSVGQSKWVGEGGGRQCHEKERSKRMNWNSKFLNNS